MLRDQDKNEILTMSGLSCADSDSTEVANPIRYGKFDNGLTGGTGLGWTVTAGVASTSGTNALSQTHEMPMIDGIPAVLDLASPLATTIAVF